MTFLKADFEMTFLAKFRANSPPNLQDLSQKEVDFENTH